MNPLTLGAIILLLVGAFYGTYTFMQPAAPALEPVPTQTSEQMDHSSHTTDTQKTARAQEEVIGTSVDGKDIVAYHFGSEIAQKELLIIGGIHGSYSSNTAKVAHEVHHWLMANPAVIPEGVSVSIIPEVNPDGLAKANMRFNSHTVDLNRNFDCNWKSEGKWQNKTVSGGSSAFSEPEALAVKAYVEKYKPAAVLALYSAAGGVYASTCDGTISAETRSLLDTYASASGYKKYDTFDSYEVNGDMTNWLAKIGIPAISVLLSDHTNTEWAKNEKGITALLNALAK